MEKVLNRILDEHLREKGNLISLLQRIQETYGHVPEESVFWFAERLDIPASRFFGVITFYPKFRTRPIGKPGEPAGPSGGACTGRRSPAGNTYINIGIAMGTATAWGPALRTRKAGGPTLPGNAGKPLPAWARNAKSWRRRSGSAGRP